MYARKVVVIDKVANSQIDDRQVARIIQNVTAV